MENLFNNAEQALALVYSELMDTSDEVRIDKYKMFRAFYEGDIEEIETRVKNALLLRGLYDADSIKKFYFQHEDIIKKVLRKLVAGVMKDQPVRELIIGEEKGVDNTVKYITDEGLDDLLEQIKYNRKIKEALSKALFVNIVLVMPVPREGKLELDILMPDQFIVRPKPNYLEIQELILIRWNGDTYYFLHFTDTEMWITTATDNKKQPVPGNSDTVNPYKRIPVEILRMEETADFYGNPNYSLLRSQISVDIKESHFDFLEILQEFGVWVSVNLKLKDDDSINPNDILRAENIKKDDIEPSLTNVVPDIKWDELRKNIETKKKSAFVSEGLSASSGSTEVQDLSGVAKSFDEGDIQNRREDIKELMYDFDIQLLELIRIVNDVNHDKLLPDNPRLNMKGYFEVTYTEEKPNESIADKKTRRDMEKEFNIKSEIDFIMEDLEVDREEAIEIRNRNIQLKKETETVKTEIDTEVNTETK